MKENFEDRLDNGDKITSKQKEDAKVSRRKFLKVAGLVVGAAAAGVGIGKLALEDKRQSKEHERRSDGVIFKKEKLALPPGGVRRIHININGKEAFFVVTVAQFDSYKVGETVTVTYDDRSMIIKSVEKKQGETSH